MYAVRRTLSTAALVGLLVPAPTAALAATPTPTPDPSATATASPDPTPAPIPSETTAPSPTDTPSAEPTSGCEQDPKICQSGGRPETTTDCDPFAASPPPSGVVCIAGGIRPGTAPRTTAGSGAGAGAPRQLPRTGPAPMVPTLTVGLWLMLLGLLVAIAGRRRTARI